MLLESPAQGYPLIPVAIWKFFSCFLTFFWAGETLRKTFVGMWTGTCGYPEGNGWCGTRSGGKRAAAMQRELKPTMSRGADKPHIQIWDHTSQEGWCSTRQWCFTHKTSHNWFSIGCSSKLFSTEPASTTPWQPGILWAAPGCEDSQLVPSLLPCCSFVLCFLQDNSGTTGHWG